MGRFVIDVALLTELFASFLGRKMHIRDNRMKRGLLLCAAAAAPLISIASGADAPLADFVIRNANIITVDASFSRAEALAVRGERILIVGDNQQIEPFIGPNTRIIDGKGKTVLPGLCDSHVHSYRDRKSVV